MARKSAASGNTPLKKRATPRKPKAAAGRNPIAATCDPGKGLPHKLLACLTDKKILFNDAINLIDTDKNIAEIENATGLTPESGWTVFDRDYPHIGDIEKTKRYKLIHELLLCSLRRGIINSYGYENGRFEPVWISEDEWKNGLSLSYFNKATRYSDEEGIDDVKLINVTLAYKANDKQQGGAPIKYDWNKLLQEWLVEVIETQKGFPQSKRAAYDILSKIYLRENPTDKNGGPSDRMFAIKMEEALPIIWASIASDKKLIM